MSDLVVTEITVALGRTVALDEKYEFARIDITNRAVLPEPLEVGSKAYRLAHKELVESVELMVNKAVAQVTGGE